MENVLDKKLFLEVKKASLVLRALNNKVRQQILKLLEQHQKLTVTEIYIHTRMLQSITSQHLSIMRRSGIVLATREGKHIYYELNHIRLAEIQSFVISLLYNSENSRNFVFGKLEFELTVPPK